MKNNVVELEYDAELEGVLFACSNYNQIHNCLKRILNNELSEWERRLLLDVFEGEPVVKLINRKK